MVYNLLKDMKQKVQCQKSIRALQPDIQVQIVPSDLSFIFSKDKQQRVHDYRGEDISKHNLVKIHIIG